MAITLVGSAADYFRGVTSDESGMNIEEIATTVKPEFKEFLMNKTNEKIGFAVAPAELDISIKGEVSDPASLPGTDFATAATLANTVEYMGAAGYDIFCDEGTFTENRSAWFVVDQKFSGNAGVSAA